MKKLVPYRKTLKQFLSKSENAAAYINGELEEGDLFHLLKAVRNVVAANGGMSRLAKATGRSRTSLYKTLSSGGNPEFSTLSDILSVYGIRLGVFPVQDPSRRHSAHRGHYLQP